MFGITDLKNKVSIIFKKDSPIVKLIDDIRFLLNAYFYVIIFFFIIMAYFNLFIMIIKEPNYQSILSYGEKGIILLATLAVLTFTYATALEYPEKNTVIRSGKYFFKSVINFAVGMIFLIGLRNNVINPANKLSFPDVVFINTFVINIILFLSGLVMLVLSGYLLVVGLIHLSKSLQEKTT